MDSISYLSELSQTNDPPPQLAIYQATEIRLKAIEDLLRVEADIEVLKEKRKRIQKSVETCNAILSPVRRLPPDILGEIFSRCLPTGRNPMMSAAEAPMLLTRVSSLWRSVAFTSPRIWAKLHIPLPGDPILSPCPGFLKAKVLATRQQDFSKVMDLRCQVVKEWLHRSGTSPLTISLRYPMDYVKDNIYTNYLHQGADTTVTDPLLHVILSFSRRWRELDLALPFPIYQKLESHVSRDMLPLLQTFKADISWGRGGERPAALADPPVRFMEAPILQRLCLKSRQFCDKTAMFPSTVWNGLTELRLISPVSDVDFFNLIKLCRNLNSCWVEIGGYWNNSQAFHPQIKLVSPIQILKINDEGRPLHIFQSIDFPSLEDLHYRTRISCPISPPGQPPSPRPPQSMFSTIENAASTIRKLTFDPRNLRREDPLICLHIASGVTHLSLGSPDRFSAFHVRDEGDMRSDDYLDLNIFAINTECEDILVPKLEVLEVYDLHQFTDETLLRILVSRIDAAQRGDVFPLRCVRMQISRQRQKDIREEVFGHAKSAGFEMKLELRYAPDRLPYRGRLSPSFLLPTLAVDSFHEKFRPDSEITNIW